MEDDLPLKKDVKGDRDNLRYGSLEKSSVPKYRLAGRGYILGLDRGHRIARTSTDRREIVATGLDSSQRQRKDSLLATIPEGRSRVVKSPTTKGDSIRRQANYVSLRRSGKRTKLSTEAEQRFSGLHDVTGSSEDNSPDEENDAPDVAAETDAFDAFRQDVIQQRHRELMKKTSEEPHSLEAWLDLIRHQEKVVQSSGSADSRLSASQRRTLTEIRVGLYEQALSRAPTREARQKLISGLMLEGGKIWDHEQLCTQWKKLLSKDASFQLRLLHLDYLMRDARSFSYEEVLLVINEYLRGPKSESSSVQRDQHMVHLLLKATVFMSQSGYNERAIAIWQATLEYNFCRPANVSSLDLLRSLQDFWDYDCPRIGEIGARGWNNFDGRTSSIRVGTGMPAESSKPQCYTDFTKWSSAERSAQMAQKLPSSALEDTEDPYRVVLFDDIRGYLWDASSEDIRTLLLNAFLHFAGLPCYTGLSPSIKDDPYLLAYNHDIDRPVQKALGPRFNGTVDATTLFALPTDPFAVFNETLSVAGLSEFSASVIQQLALAHPQDEALAEYCIALELRLRPESVRKLAKKFLKQRPTSTRLYNAFAMIESRLGNTQAAEKVWLAILGMKSGKMDGTLYDLTPTLMTWVWNCTRKHDSCRALRILNSITDLTTAVTTLTQPLSETPAQESLRQAEDRLWSALTEAHMKNRTFELVLITDLLALLNYNRSAHSLNSALEIYNKTLSLSTLHPKQTSITPVHVDAALEALHTHRNHLIYHHTTTPHRIFRPADILPLLRASHTLFPTNTTFLTHLHQFSTRHGGIDRLRDPSNFTTSSLTNDPTLLSHLHTLRTELARDPQYGGTEYAIRAAFTSATASDSIARSCAAVHVARVRWELDLLRKAKLRGQSGKAKEWKKKVNVFVDAFRTAVAACPWVKELYLCYFDEVLEGEVGDREDVWRGMIERGIRVRVEYDPEAK